jgi:hypothetical protein
VLAVIVLGFGIRGLSKFSTEMEIVLLVILGAFVALGMIISIAVEIPYLGRVALEPGVIEVTRLGYFELEFRNVSSSFVENLFVMINWNLLWYLFPLFLIYYIIYPVPSGRRPYIEILPLLAAIFFIVFVFTFTRHYQAAMNFATINRALLYLVPAMIFCIFLLFQKREPASRGIQSGVSGS